MAPLRVRLRVYEVSKALCLQQVKLVVGECTSKGALDKSFPKDGAYRRVNSPGSAGRHCGKLTSATANAISNHQEEHDQLILSNSPRTTAGPPCTWNSATSSPVKLRGPGNHDTSPRSIKAPVPVRRLARASIRGSGGLVRPVTACKAARACAPEQRTIATPALPCPVASATMVCAAALMFTLPPLSNLKPIV